MSLNNEPSQPKNMVNHLNPEIEKNLELLKSIQESLRQMVSQVHTDFEKLNPEEQQEFFNILDSLKDIFDELAQQIKQGKDLDSVKTTLNSLNSSLLESLSGFNKNVQNFADTVNPTLDKLGITFRHIAEILGAVATALTALVTIKNSIDSLRSKGASFTLSPGDPNTSLAQKISEAAKKYE